MQRSRAALDRLVEILDERFHEPLTVPDLAREVGLSRNYLARLFRDRMGLTVQRYIANRRMELARHLLSTSRLSIKEIGAKVGWPDPQHFNKQFHRLAGLSPSAARALAASQ
jgi:transcriptional regulator GlxA family with amidase domain